MDFSLGKSLEILENTPGVLAALLTNLSDEWVANNEGENTWSAKEVVAHLIVCEETSWIPRARMILSDGDYRTFAAIDMNAHFEITQLNSISGLITRFRRSREQSVVELRQLNLQESDLIRTGTHPKLGTVTPSLSRMLR